MIYIPRERTRNGGPLVVSLLLTPYESSIVSEEWGGRASEGNIRSRKTTRLSQSVEVGRRRRRRRNPSIWCRQLLVTTATEAR